MIVETKTLKERAEEARIEDEKASKIYWDKFHEERSQEAISFFKESIPEAVYIKGVNKFELGGELFPYTSEGTRCYLDPCYMHGLYYIPKFSNLAGYGRYLQRKEELERQALISNSKKEEIKKLSFLDKILAWFN